MIRQKSIYLSISTLLISLALILGASQVHAQKLKIEVLPDSVPFFRGLSVGADIFGVIQRQVSDYGQYEANLRVNLKDKYFPVFELGIGDADHKDDAVTGISVKTRAPYGRIGCDFNVLKNKHDDYRAFVGLRYAYTKFDFELSHKGVDDPVWGGTAEYGTKENCYYHWLEALFAVDAKVIGPVRLGWSVRYRRRIASSDCSTGEVWYVPGFGKAKKTCIGGSFNIAVEI